MNGDALSFRAKSGSRTFQVFYQLQSEEEQAYFKHLDHGLELRIKGELEPPTKQRNFMGFDYQAYLKTQGIYHLLKISHILEKRPAEPRDFIGLLSSWRRKALVWVHQHFPQPMSHYMTGLLFGFLDVEFEEMSQLYSNLGIIHLFALSGMQVAFFLDAFRRFFLRLGLEQEKVVILLYPFSLLYAGMTGFSVSVVRSLLQKLLAQAGLKGMENMGVTLLLLIVLLPSSLLTAGGLLSCAYAFVLTLTSTEEEKEGIRKVIKESLVLTLGVLPFLLFFFGEYQPWSLPLTFIFSLLFDLLLLPGLSVVFLLSFLYPLTFWNPFFVWMEKSMEYLASFTSQSLVFGQPSIYYFILLLCLLACLYEMRKVKKWRYLFLLLVCSVFALVKHPLENEITMVDIGQGDSIFLRDWKGRTILIDVGGRVTFKSGDKWQERSQSANADKTLIPYLKSRGVGKLDALILTHTDQDHMGDMVEVARQIPVKKVYVSPGSLTSSKFQEKLKQLHSPIKVVQRGDRLPIFDHDLEVLSPDEVGDGKNDDSIVLYGQFYQKRFLFTGDLEEAGEKKLLENDPQLQVDILKVGHHGSKGSSSDVFLDQLHPHLALISVGKKNRYQHPHKELLDRLEERSISYLRTDERGAIRLIGWDHWRVETVR